MAKSTKWAEQCLNENTFGYKDENGNEVTNKLNCLQVCLSGKELYRKEFMEGKYQGRNMLTMPFDFIVVMGSMGAPDGRFYELEYTIGEYGVIYRALIQAAKPVEDLQLIIGLLKKENLLPANLKPHRAYLRDDIDAVCIGNCSKDEDGEAVFISGHKDARDSDESLLQRAVKNSNTGVCIEFYRNDCHEVWIPKEGDCSKEKVFVCGVNGDDPDFAEERARDLEEMQEHITEAIGIAQEYGLNLFFAYEDGEKNDKGERITQAARIGTEKWFFSMVDYLMKITDVVEDDTDETNEGVDPDLN